MKSVFLKFFAENSFVSCFIPGATVGISIRQAYIHTQIGFRELRDGCVDLPFPVSPPVSQPVSQSVDSVVSEVL